MPPLPLPRSLLLQRLPRLRRLLRNPLPPHHLRHRSPLPRRLLPRQSPLRATKSAAHHWSAKLLAKIISTSRRCPAPAQAAAFRSPTSSPLSKAALRFLPALRNKLRRPLPLSARRRLRHRRLRPRDPTPAAAFSKTPCRAKKCTSAITKCSPCP